MTSIPPAPPIAVQLDVEEILQSPPTASAPLIADKNVASGSYRRPSLPSPVHSFRSVTATSPLSSPDEEDSQQLMGTAGATDRNGRRRMLRSGTSGSITPLSAHSPEAEFSRQNSVDSRPSASSSSSSSIPSPTAFTSTQGLDKADNTMHASVSPKTRVDSIDDEARPTLATQRTNSSHLRPTDPPSSSSTRSDGLLSIPSTPAATDLYRTPSQISIASDADGYFTARPGSPIEPYDLLRAHPDKARIALRRDRVSWSGHSYSTATSDYAASDHMGATLSIGDEACYIDGQHELAPIEDRHREQGKPIDQKEDRSCIDFLWDLPPELALCILYMLDSHKDLLAISRVSRRWRAFATNQFLWRDLFFAQPDWAIREDAPLVLKHQVELQRIANRAARKAMKEEAERLRRIQEQRKAASTSSPYLDRLAALKSWKDNLHIPSFPQLAGLSLSSTSRNEVDVDTGRSITPAMSPLRSPTAATGRFGLFLSPGRPAPSTPAGARRAIEASLSSSYFGSYDSGGVDMSRHTSAGSLRPSRRPSAISEHYAEVAEAEEFFAESLNWRKLYKDRWVLQQRWLSPQYPTKAETSESSTAGGAPMSREPSASSTSDLTPQTPGSVARPGREKSWFEPTRRWLRGHKDSVYCIRQDDGLGTGTPGKIVSGSRDCTIRVWDAEMGDTKHILTGHAASVLALQYDDRILVSVSSDGQVFIWDFAAILASMTNYTATNGTQVTVDIESGALVHDRYERVHCVLREHTSAVLDVVFDERWIVTGSKDATVRVWRRAEMPMRDVETNDAPAARAPRACMTFEHIGPVNAVDLQGNQVVSASGEGSMFLWDLETGQRKHTFRGHTKGLACIVFKGNTLISGSNDQTIRVWDTVSGRCTHVLGDHQSLVRTVAFCPQRRLVISGGYDRMIKLWRLDDGESQTGSSPQAASAEEQEEETIDGEQSHDIPAPASPEQDGEDEHRPVTGKCLRDIRCHRARIFDVDFNVTRIVSASEDHMICVTNFGSQGIDTSLFA
ncbi:WD40 repeat [Kalmanozyma brasiliensis GHG001]|uniref:WD40 repeat n=1 Tax=Kalmanozyma brasiliensis (strain GHG001) TaxID=1365824 RepID=UPI0028681DEB|nr:WD40 repeat [Kalmanozyma brasiliensis GHG001]KAF6767528.1 WD40 repeat [Kalmanozyma brasiliensis GHG001]